MFKSPEDQEFDRDMDKINAKVAKMVWHKRKEFSFEIKSEIEYSEEV